MRPLNLYTYTVLLFHLNTIVVYSVFVTEFDEYDVAVGANVRKFRQARGLNQDELAARVAERGVPFRQQTIVKIEKGQRPLRLREADAITAALDIDIDTLVGDEVAIDWATLLMRHTREVAQNWDALMRTARQLLVAQAQVQHDLNAVKQMDIPVEDHILNEATTMLRVNPDEVLTAVRQQLEAERVAETADRKAGVIYTQHNQGAGRG